MRLLFPLLLSVLLLGCSANSLVPGKKLEDDVAELQRRVLELQRQAAVNEVELSRLRRQIAELREGVPAGNVSREAPASAPVLEELPTEPGPFEDIEQADIDDPDPPAEEPVRRIVVPDPSTDGAAPTLSSSGQELYDEAYTLYNRGDYLDAEAGFQRFLETYRSSDLADNAQYWIGECRYSRGDLRGALAAFRGAIDGYPSGNKVPDALLKAGQVLEELGDRAGARDSYRELQRRFPESPAALTATERLNAL